MAILRGAIADFGKEFRPQAAGVWKRLHRLLALWARRRHERLILAELDERLLRDIGVDRLAAMQEARRPFWQGSERQPRRWWRG